MVSSLLSARLCLQGRGVNRCEASPGHLRRCRLIVSHATEWITRRWSGHHGDDCEDDERGEDHQELPVEAVGVCEVLSMRPTLIVVLLESGNEVFSQYRRSAAKILVTGVTVPRLLRGWCA